MLNMEFLLQSQAYFIPNLLQVQPVFFMLELRVWYDVIYSKLGGGGGVCVFVCVCVFVFVFVFVCVCVFLCMWKRRRGEGVPPRSQNPLSFSPNPIFLISPPYPRLINIPIPS